MRSVHAGPHVVVETSYLANERAAGSGARGEFDDANQEIDLARHDSERGATRTRSHDRNATTRESAPRLSFDGSQDPEQTVATAVATARPSRGRLDAIYLGL